MRPWGTSSISSWILPRLLPRGSTTASPVIVLAERTRGNVVLLVMALALSEVDLVFAVIVRNGHAASAAPAGAVLAGAAAAGGSATGSRSGAEGGRRARDATADDLLQSCWPARTSAQVPRRRTSRGTPSWTRTSAGSGWLRKPCGL